jgi:transmembrane sensor
MNVTGKSPEDYQIEDFVTDESFINYFFQLNTDDKTFWEKWLIAHPHNNEIVDAAKTMLRDLSLTLPEKEFEDELLKIRKAIRYEAPLSTKKRPAIIRLLRWDKSAGSSGNKKKRYANFILPVVCILFIGGYFFLRQFSMHAGQLSEKFNDSSKPIVFTLSDGTVVTLAPQSIFRYPADFGNGERKVYLDGEAQFHVNRDEAHPFKVYEGDIVATVLGTVFNVKKQAGDSLLLVELIKGKLKVESLKKNGSIDESVILNPDERVLYRRDNKKLYKEKWESQNDASLQVNRLLFRQNNFEEIANQLKTVFGVTVINQSNKKTWRFTGEFNNASVTDILESICIVEKLKYEVRGDTIFIK